MARNGYYVLLCGYEFEPVRALHAVTQLLLEPCGARYTSHAWQSVLASSLIIGCSCRQCLQYLWSMMPVDKIEAVHLGAEAISAAACMDTQSDAVLTRNAERCLVAS
jgi:hypothetical protein